MLKVPLSPPSAIDSTLFDAGATPGSVPSAPLETPPTYAQEELKSLAREAPNLTDAVIARRLETPVNHRMPSHAVELLCNNDVEGVRLWQDTLFDLRKAGRLSDQFSNLLLYGRVSAIGSPTALLDAMISADHSAAVDMQIQLIARGTHSGWILRGLGAAALFEPPTRLQNAIHAGHSLETIAAIAAVPSTTGLIQQSTAQLAKFVIGGHQNRTALDAALNHPDPKVVALLMKTAAKLVGCLTLELTGGRQYVRLIQMSESEFHRLVLPTTYPDGSNALQQRVAAGHAQHLKRYLKGLIDFADHHQLSGKALRSTLSACLPNGWTMEELLRSWPDCHDVFVQAVRDCRDLGMLTSQTWSALKLTGRHIREDPEFDPPRHHQSTQTETAEVIAPERRETRSIAVGTDGSLPRPQAVSAVPTPRAPEPGASRPAGAGELSAQAQVQTHRHRRSRFQFFGCLRGNELELQQESQPLTLMPRGAGQTKP